MASRRPRPARETKPVEEVQPAWRKSVLRENFESIVVAVLFAVFVRAFIAQPYKIPSGSMEDTLLIGDHLVVNKVALGDGASREGLPLFPTRPIERGDVVIFRPPHDDSTDYIKRVIGMPGDELVLTYSPERRGVRVHVNGEPLPESYRLGHFTKPTTEVGADWIVTFAGAPAELTSGRPVSTHHVGEDEYFVMGDNRNDSADSRFWSGDIRTVKGERIRGIAWFIYWSYDTRGEDPEPRGFVRRLVHYGRIAIGFFSRSRWERTFQPIR